MSRHWELKQGETLLGELHPDGADMPWHLCRFVAAEGWESAREQFEELAAAVSNGDGRRFVAAAGTLRAAGLRLVPVGFDQPDLAVWDGALLHIADGRARLRH